MLTVLPAVIAAGSGPFAFRAAGFTVTDPFDRPIQLLIMICYVMGALMLVRGLMALILRAVGRLQKPPAEIPAIRH